MQLNIAFEPASPQELLPGPRPNGCRSPKPAQTERHSPVEARDRESTPSFKSSLREARRDQESAGRPEKLEKGRQESDEAPESCRKSKADDRSVASDSDDAQTIDDEKADCGSDDKINELLDQLLAQGSGNEEGAVDELAGAEGVTLAVQTSENLEVADGARLMAEATSGTGRGESVSPDVAGGPAANVSEMDLSGSKAVIPGLNTPVPASDSDKAAGGAEAGNADATGMQKGESNAADSIKSFEALIQPEARSAATAKDEPGSQSNAGPGVVSKTDVDGQLGEPSQLPRNMQAGQGGADHKSQDARVSQPEDVPPARSGEVSSEQQGAGRVQGDLQQNREGDGKLDLASGDEMGPKLTKVTAVPKDTAFMHQQEQNFDRLMDPATAAREKDGAAGAWRAQTIEHIVNRAVYHLKDGQNSVRIDLKPEFLGQVRMQIVTVEQQVSIRITAELPMVKEMLENNLQQLRAGLQMQGLEVDEIEVSVSADSQQNAQNRRMQFEEMAASNAGEGGPNESDFLPAPEAVAPSVASNRTVDMFA